MSPVEWLIILTLFALIYYIGRASGYRNGKQTQAFEMAYELAVKIEEIPNERSTQRDEARKVFTELMSEEADEEITPQKWIQMYKEVKE